MSLLFADGFSLYGTGATSETNMAQGIYATVSAGVQCLTTNPRAPGTHHLRISGSNDELRRVLGGDFATGIGIGFALYLSNLPTNNDRCLILQLRDGANLGRITFTLQSTGVLEVRRGDHGGTLIASSAAVFTAGAYQHVEIFCIGHLTTGEVEVRRNGETVISFTGNTGSGTIEQYAHRWQGSADTGVDVDFADVHGWDESGSVNNTFLGDVVWYRLNPTSDTAETDWVRNAGANDFDAIDDTTPDGDTTYIEAGTAGDVSDFGMSNLPGTASAIIAVVTQPMARKTDAGAGSLQVTLLSSNIGSPPAPAESDGDDRPITTAYTYYPDIHEVDPATGVAWTPSAVNAMQLRLTRTA